MIVMTRFRGTQMRQLFVVLSLSAASVGAVLLFAPLYVTVEVAPRVFGR